MEKSELQQFIDDTTQQPQDIFEQPLTPEQGDGEQSQRVSAEEEETNLRNRRERRLAAKLQQEREAGIELAARLRAITEAQQLREAPDAEHLQAVERIYGTDSPEAKEATQLLKHALQGVEERATERALAVLREEQEAAEQQVAQAEHEVDAILEEIEDEYNTDLTSNNAARTAYLKLLERMSPKDQDGNITQFADHHAVWEVYQSRKERQVDTRAKDLSARSMVQSGASKDSTIQEDATARYLRENGII